MFLTKNSSARYPIRQRYPTNLRFYSVFLRDLFLIRGKGYQTKLMCKTHLSVWGLAVVFIYLCFITTSVCLKVSIIFKNFAHCLLLTAEHLHSLFRVSGSLQMLMISPN